MKSVSAALLLSLVSRQASGFATVKNAQSRESPTKLHMSDKTRVVVTGLGVISGCGIGHDDFFDACLKGESSLDTVKRFDASNYPCSIASEVPDEMFDAKGLFHQLQERTVKRSVYALRRSRCETSPERCWTGRHAGDIGKS